MPLAHTVNIMETGKKSIKDNTRSQALRVKGILQSGSIVSRRRSRSTMTVLMSIISVLGW